MAVIREIKIPGRAIFPGGWLAKIEGIANRFRSGGVIGRHPEEGALRRDGEFYRRRATEEIRMPKRHPNRPYVEAARGEIQRAVLAAVTENGLTLAEEQEILAGIMRDNARDAIQQERHPNDPDASPDEASNG